MKNGEQRQSKRHALRVPCLFRLPSGEQTGFVTNVSTRGFFVETRSQADAGLQIVLTIEHEPDPPMIITGTVIRQRRSRRWMIPVEQPGIGVKIETAPESFYRLVLDIEEKE